MDKANSTVPRPAAARWMRHEDELLDVEGIEARAEGREVPSGTDSIIGDSAVMQCVLTQISQVAPTDATVL